MAQQLGVLATLAKDPGSVPRNHMGTVCNSSFSDPKTSGLQGHQACKWYTYIHTGKNTHADKIKKIYIFNKA